jgi:hypothetical protein
MNFKQASKVTVFLTIFLIGCSNNNQDLVVVEGVFNQSPKLMPMEDRKWVLLDDFIFTYWDISKPSVRFKIIVPKGFVTDLASIPRFTSFVFNNYAAYAPAGVLHDFLYWTQPQCDGNGRYIADKLYRDALKMTDITTLNRWLQWGGLKLAKKAWDQNKKNKMKGQSRYLNEKFWPQVKPNSTWENEISLFAKKQAPWELKPDESICAIKPMNQT